MFAASDKVFYAFVLSLVCIEAGYLGGYGGVEISEGDIYSDGHQEHNDHPKYQFNYAVHDPHTGDEKQHIEERDGDEVKGTYTVKEADGTTRVVEYKADKHNGFNAVVHKIGEPNHAGQGNIGVGYGSHY